MRIAKDAKLIFISIPKTGSLSGFNFMEENFNCIEEGWYHNVIVPAKYMKYKKFTFVRNPYDRFVSLYNAILVLGGPKKKYRRSFLRYSKDDSIISFAKVLGNNHKRLTFELRLAKAQHIHLDESNAKDIKLIHIENASEEFNKWFKGKKNYIIPHNRKRVYPGWDEVKTPKLIKLVNVWAGKDFEMSGYDKE